jgi:hypothetical protein
MEPKKQRVKKQKKVVYPTVSANDPKYVWKPFGDVQATWRRFGWKPLGEKK